MGGSDLWESITAGIELIGRREQKKAHGLVFPLLTTAAGNTSPEVLEAFEGEVPVSSLALADLSKGVPLLDALVTAGLASSKADAKRGVEQKGFSVNGEVAAPGRSLGEEDLRAGRYVVLQKGNKALCHAGSHLEVCFQHLRRTRHGVHAVEEVWAEPQ